MHAIKHKLFKHIVLLAVVYNIVQIPVTHWKHAIHDSATKTSSAVIDYYHNDVAIVLNSRH